MRATIRDVARNAGVSISTVSRVLNNTCPVDEDKRRRVHAAAESLRYTPDPAARSLLKRETGGIGVLVPSVSEEFFSEFLTGIDRHAQENHYYLLISSSHRSKEEFERALASLYGRVDGLLVMAPDKEGFDPNHPVLRSTPVVYVNTRLGKGYDAIGIDNYGGFYKMTYHLAEKGHRRFAIINGLPGTFDAQERRRGFRAALTDFGLNPDEALEVSGDFTRRSGYQAVEPILSAAERPTVIMAANDLSALGALSALHENGISVPDDIALSGFDDVPAAHYSTPPLSTVRVPIRELGIAAIGQIIKRVQNGTTKETFNEQLPVELVLRASTGDTETNFQAP